MCLSQDVTSLHEASGNDIEFEKTLLQAYQETCLPHFRRVQAELLAEAREQDSVAFVAHALFVGRHVRGKQCPLFFARYQRQLIADWGFACCPSSFGVGGANSLEREGSCERVQEARGRIFTFC